MPLPPLLTIVLETDEFLVERAVTRVVEASRAADPQTERRDVDGTQDGAAGALLTALSPSLFAEAAVVVLAGLTASDDRLLDALIAGLSDPDPNVSVVALFPTGSRAKKAMDRLRGAAEAGAPTGAQRPALAEVAPAGIKGRAWNQFASEEFVALKRRATSEAIEALLAAVGSNTRMIASAVQQLCHDVTADPIEASDVLSTFGGIADMPGYEIADAVWSRDKVLALQRLRWAAEAAPANIGPAVVGALSSSLRSLVRVQSMGGAPEATVAREAGIHPFKVKILRGQLRRWSMDELGAAAVGLARLDAAVKGGVGGGVALDNEQKVHALEKWIIRTVG